MKKLLTNCLSLITLLALFQACNPQSKGDNSSSIGYLKHYPENEATELLFDNGVYHLFYGKGHHAKSADMLMWETQENTILGKSSIAYSVASYKTPCAIELSSDQKFALLEKDTTKNAFWKRHSENLIINQEPAQIKDLALFSHPSGKYLQLALLSEKEVWFYTSENKTEWTCKGKTNLSSLPAKENWNEIDIEYIQNSNNELKPVLFLTQHKGSPNGGGAVAYFAGEFNDGIFEKSSNKNGWVHFGSDYEHLAITSLRQNKLFQVVGLGMVAGQEPEASNPSKTRMTTPDEFLLDKQLGYPFVKTRPFVSGNLIGEKVWGSENLQVDGNLFIEQPIEAPSSVTLKYDMNNRKYLDFAEAFGIKLSDGDRTLELGYHNFKRYFFVQYSEHKTSTGNMRPYFAPYIFSQDTLTIEVILFRDYVKLTALDGAVCLTRKLGQGFDPESLILFSEKGKSKLTEINIKKLNYKLK